MLVVKWTLLTAESVISRVTLSVAGSKHFLRVRSGDF
jgi:hypothetical protein